MSGHEQSYIAEAFRANWLTTAGANLDGFEREMSARLAGRHTLAVSSGTAALHLVLRYLGVGPGDRVAVSTLTFAGSVFPILYLGAEPVFVDSERQSWNLDPDVLESYLRDAARRDELPKALVLVHLYGQHADVDRIRALCDEFEVALVEDAAESLGATYKGRETGCTADFAILSFNGNKIITTTGGGMIVARSADAIRAMRKWAHQSREPAVEYVHEELGYNYRMSNVLAGIGRGQLTVLDERVAARRAVAARYRDALADIPGVALQPEAEWGTHSRWLSVLLFDPEERPVDPATLVLALEVDDIETRPVWRPMHTQPLFRHARRVGGEVAESLFASGLCLPSSSSLSAAAQDRVIDALRRALTGSLAAAR
ncbi:DegT/DnrJ/EryC1/StrS aminotransferase [Gemmatirosa kalamazoonensis]|uniref:DegT/DnrJ/EryC1/StrS aminotransferase n=1 Tax=Gemmatirosa kalamazoonensis TaxID=861299 RepID=W0RL25_9BACT|nr:DegT/DnrJ/EryC1/StrS family aminotransferase [Gemmatirosa kalamazoonensis]AHG91030.1 DegT/DnrJ/EryC1/StrS aminotransferase [Gemmatirosa kalamazoonensis]